MPKSALPEHLQDLSAWDGTDNGWWLMKAKKWLQYFFVAGPRVPGGFWRWREMPKTLFILFGGGDLRYESSNGSVYMPLESPAWPGTYEAFYLSRIQPWCRWHVALQWPLFFQCHFIYRNRNVFYPMHFETALGITKMVTFSIGYKRDGDRVYWPTAYFGGNFE